MNVKLQTPTVPNFIRVMITVRGQRQDGFKELPMVSVGDLTDEQLESIAKNWREELFLRAKNQRMNKEAR